MHKGENMSGGLKRRLVEQARKMHGTIFPCGLRTSLEECFTLLDDMMMLWYNTQDRSTHVVVARAKSPHGFHRR